LEKFRFLFKGVVGYASFVKHTYSLNKYSKEEIAKYRLKVIKFHDSYGTKAAKEAFSVGRSTVFLWKKTLREAGGSLMSLCPKSTAPVNRRRMKVDPKVLDFITNLRLNTYRLGKDKIKTLLDAYCSSEGLETISPSKIGRIIKTNNLIYPKGGRVYHDPSKKPTIPGTKRRKERLPKGTKAARAGDLLQLDTVVKFDLGVRRYIITAIDLYSRFAFAFAYTKLSSAVALDFYRRLEVVAPFKIKSVKTDNGLEFLGNFDRYLRKKGVIHYFSYPRTPKSNAYIERFNRTIQEDFVDDNLELLPDTHSFNDRMMDYLLFYNTVRPHKSLKQQTPMGFMISEDHKSNMLWTRTFL
jgi:putative transposase